MVDDVHLLEGSDAELALADLIRRLPARMRLLMASRVDLGLDLSRLRVSGQLVEIGPDDLRFRAWEVEELFRDVYREPLIPEDVATLARRTAGWAAYLQLFHLATARKPLAEKRQVLASLANRARLVQEYLTRHVLAELSPDLQDFLIRTSVLRRPRWPCATSYWVGSRAAGSCWRSWSGASSSPTASTTTATATTPCCCPTSKPAWSRPSARRRPARSTAGPRSSWSATA